MRTARNLTILTVSAVAMGCRGPARHSADADPAASGGDVRAEVAAFERAWAAAADARDRARLDSLMAPEWTITLADGRRSDKPRALAHWTAPPDAGVLRDTTLVDSVDVRALGPDAAVAIAAIRDVEVRRDGADTTRTRVTDVVVRRGGRWQALVSHESVLPAPAGRQP
jgi:ketosteroid isomerase-like protein